MSSQSGEWTRREHDFGYKMPYRSTEFDMPHFEASTTKGDKIREKTKIGTYTGSGVQLSEVYSNKELVKPTWFRVSQTPFHGAAVATGGYGRRIDDTSVSLDAPDFFHIDEVINHNLKITYGEHHHHQHGPRHANAESHDAPDWWKHEHHHHAARAKHLGLRGKQLIMEPLLPQFNKKAIDWGAPRSIACDLSMPSWLAGWLAGWRNGWLAT